MSLINKKLSELKLSKEVVDVYRDHICDDSLTGIVSDFDEKFLYLCLLTEGGEDNGISIVFRENITRIRTEGNVRKSIFELSEFRSTTLSAPSIELGSIANILSSIQSVYGYVNIHAELMNDDMCFIGQVIEQDSDWVSLNGFGTMISRDTNILLIGKDEISRVDAGAKYEESIKYLAGKAKK